MSKQETGRIGEAIACAYVRRLGWKVLHQNWRCTLGELDMIADDGCELVVVEVRTRRGKAALARALESVDMRKQQQILRVTEHYLHQLQLPPEQALRIDVIGVALHPDDTGSVEHVRDAYQW